MNKNKELLPFYERAKEIYSYNPETGDIYRLIKGDGSRRSCKVSYNGYVSVNVTINKVNKTISGHRFAWFVMTGIMPNEIDHLNRVKHDNRWINLSNGTHYDNMQNRSAFKPRTKWTTPRTRDNGDGSYRYVKNTNGASTYYWSFYYRKKLHYRSGFGNKADAYNSVSRYIENKLYLD